MRIVADCRLLGVPRAGSAYYLLGLLRGLAVIDDANEYVLMCQRPLDDEDTKAGHFHQVVIPQAALCDPHWEQLHLPAKLRRIESDLYFSAASVVPMLRCCPQMIVCYDLGFLHFPEFYARRVPKSICAHDGWAELLSRLATPGSIRAYLGTAPTPREGDQFWDLTDSTVALSSLLRNQHLRLHQRTEDLPVLKLEN